MADGRVVIDIDANGSQAIGETEKVKKSLFGLGPAAEKSNGGFGSIVKSSALFGTVAGAAMAVVTGGINAMKSSLGGAVARFDTLNAYPKVMAQMGYSTDDVTKSVGILKKGVDGLPTSLQDLTKSAQGFAILEKSATKGAETATALNDAFLASGASAGDASRGVEQYSQMLASGTVDLQSWRTLQETMPYALTKVANSFGLTGKSAERDLYAKLKAGQITVDQLNARFVELDGGVNGFANTARTASGGIGTSFTNMKNAVVNGLTNMLTAIDNGMKTAGLGGIAAIFDQMKQGIIASFAVINGAVQAGMVVIGGAIKGMAGIFTTVLGPALAFAKQSFDVFVQGTITALQPMSGLINHIKNDIDRSFDAGSATSALIGAFSQVINVLTMVRNVVIDVVKGFLNTNAVQSVWQAIVSVTTAVFNIIQSLVVAVGNVIGSFQSVDSSKSVWESLGTTIGNIVTAIANVVQAVGDFINMILAIPGATDVISALVFSIGGLVLAFKVVGTAVSVVVTVINTFKTAVAVARGVMLAFNAALAANPLGIIVLAITAVVSALIWFFTQTQTGQAMWSSFVNFLVETWNNFSATISVITQAIVDGMQAAWNVLVTVLEAPVIAVIAFINGGFSGLMTSLALIWSSIVNNLSIIWNNIVLIASSIFPGLGTLISNIFLAIGNFFTAWGTGILEFLTMIFNGIISVITTVVNGVYNVIVSVWNAIPGFVSGLWNGIVAFLSGIWNGLVSGAIGFANNLFSGVRSIWNSIPGWASGLWNSVLGTISGVWNGIVSTVVSMANSAINGLKGAWNGITGWVSGLWNGVKSTIRSAMNFDLSAAGRAIMSSFLGGLQAAWGAVKSFVGGIASWIKEHKGPISYDKKLLIPAGKAIMTGFGNALEDHFSDVKTSVSSFAGQISDVMATGIDNNANTVVNAMSNMVDSAISAVQDADIAGSVQDAFNVSPQVSALLGGKFTAEGSIASAGGAQANAINTTNSSTQTHVQNITFGQVVWNGKDDIQKTLEDLGWQDNINRRGAMA
ncbi:tape measure protein [Leuconostoc lactis]|uniref:tape measure protein n=1 Tax=Leuconostoc lactis TaxID=1246 RepID=UPI001D100DDE|nr:tape measure protein [Leuconostoc lactis]MCC2745017.1 tape measure protein [Leuconostoc lactis]MCC2755555.1 tape measure protein [Leuconostoc lactis]